MNRFMWNASLLLCLVGLSCNGRPGGQPVRPVVLQLNWLHDPTFAGEYAAALGSGSPLTLKEGGPNVFPLAEVVGGRVDAAVVGTASSWRRLTNRQLHL